MCKTGELSQINNFDCFLSRIIFGLKIEKKKLLKPAKGFLLGEPSSAFKTHHEFELVMNVGESSSHRQYSPKLGSFTTLIVVD
jgi:hypothetical protein